MAAAGQSGSRNVLVTGGAGFVGSNLVARLLADPEAQVTVFDNLSRRGVEHNLSWLRSLPQQKQLRFIHGDVRHFADVIEAAKNADEIYHLAAQVAVTTSVEDPRGDFDVNAAGTINVLEGARRSGRQPLFFFTSTNKVYGALESVGVHEYGLTYRANDLAFRGVDEATPLDFHSPYGCSKGAADQYVRDYARIYELPAIVFRMSCIAGPRQFGNEDQGWVAHFLYSALADKPITVYGTGRQVRDILHVDDLIDAIVSVRQNLPRTAGEIYNVGGAMEQSVSVRGMLTLIEKIAGVTTRCKYADARPGDQPLYISNISKIEAHTGWHPRRPLEATLIDILNFWHAHRGLIQEFATLKELPICSHVGQEDLIANEVA